MLFGGVVVEEEPYRGDLHWEDGMQADTRT